MATLARLRITDTETTMLMKQMTKALGLFEHLQKCDTSDSGTLPHITGMTNVMRNDVVQSFSNPSELTACSPLSRGDQSICVKKVL